jgi:hypothetical protein
VVNGISPANRGTRWSNSGMVVEIRPEDIAQIETGQPAADSEGDTDETMRMMRLQEQLELTCWQQGNMQQTAPAQRMADFVNRRLSYDLPESSYAPGLISSPLHFWMPSFITSRLQQAFTEFGRRSHGFLTNEAVLIAAETRTSSPVRILRQADTLQHVRLEGLFPCGEGRAMQAASYRQDRRRALCRHGGAICTWWRQGLSLPAPTIYADSHADWDCPHGCLYVLSMPAIGDGSHAEWFRPGAGARRSHAPTKNHPRSVSVALPP